VTLLGDERVDLLVEALVGDRVREEELALVVGGKIGAPLLWLGPPWTWQKQCAEVRPPQLLRSA